jgi:foldase protein PrsA
MYPKAQKFRKILKKKISVSDFLKFSGLIVVMLILFSMYKKGIIAPIFINGEPVTAGEILISLEKGGNGNIINKIIAEKVIEIEARKRNIQVRKEEIDAEILRLEKKAIENGTTLLQLLRDSNQTAADLEKNVKLRITVYKILEEDLNVTEKEIDDYIYENKDLYKDEEIEIIRQQTKEMLIQKKVEAKYDTWIKDASANTKIDYLISF